MWFKNELGAFALSRTRSPALHNAEESQYIVQIGNDKQKNQDAEANILSTLHELIARLAACNDFIKEEEHMSTIQCRNRKNVHERQDNAQEAVIIQKACQSHIEGNKLPKAPKPPKLLAPSLENTYFISPT